MSDRELSRHEDELRKALVVLQTKQQMMDEMCAAARNARDDPAKFGAIEKRVRRIAADLSDARSRVKRLEEIIKCVDTNKSNTTNDKLDATYARVLRAQLNNAHRAASYAESKNKTAKIKEDILKAKIQAEAAERSDRAYQELYEQNLMHHLGGGGGGVIAGVPAAQEQMTIEETWAASPIGGVEEEMKVFRSYVNS